MVSSLAGRVATYVRRPGNRPILPASTTGPSKMELKIRAAQPDDVEAAVPLIYSSGPAAFDYVFSCGANRTSQDFLRYAFRRQGGEFSHRNHTVVTHNDEVVGTGACYSSATSLAFLVSVFRQVIGFYGIRKGLQVARRGTQIEQMFKLPNRRQDYIAHLGVQSEKRGLGIGRELVEYFLEASRSAGQTHATLDVSAENPRAQSLYERIGFQVVEERVSRIDEVPNHRRMEIRL